MPADEGRALQLRLSLSANTSFKRSFEELFGGAESDDEEVTGGGAGVTPGRRMAGQGGRNRNKRQRSGDSGTVGREEEEEEEGASDTASSASGSSSTSSLALSLSLSPTSTNTTTSSTSSTGTGFSIRQNLTASAAAPLTSAATTTSVTSTTSTTTTTATITSLPTHESLPPRLPTPRLDDVQMSDIPLLEDDEDLPLPIPASSSGSGSGTSSGTGPDHLSHPSRSLYAHPTPSPTIAISSTMVNSTGTISTAPTPLLSGAAGERFRVTMDRYNTFESAMAALRHPHTPPRPVPALGSGRPNASPPRLPPLQLSSLQEEEEEERGLFGASNPSVTVGTRSPSMRDPLGSDHRASATTGGSDSSLSIHIATARVRTQANLGLGGSRAGVDSGDSSDEGEDGEDRHQPGSAVVVGDVPPRIELSNSVWSSFGIGDRDGRVDEGDHDGEAEDEEDEEETELAYPDPPFRDRLDSALEALRSPSSPLVPGLVPGDEGHATGPSDGSASSVSLSTSTSTSSATVQAPHVAGTGAATSTNVNDAPPTLPPILTDRDSEVWQRDLDVHEAQGGRHRVQRLGEVRLPSPSLSGFYAWLEEASANVSRPSTRESGSISITGSDHPASTSGSDFGPESRPGTAETQTQSNRSGGRSWEEDVLAGFLSSDIDLGLEQREGQRNDTSVRGPSGFGRLQRERDSIVMDVDMESDTERGGVESLPWSLGPSPSSSTPLRSSLNSDWVRRPTWSSVSNGSSGLRRSLFSERSSTSMSTNEAGSSSASAGSSAASAASPPLSSSSPSHTHQLTFSSNLFSPSSPPYHSSGPSSSRLTSGAPTIRLPRHISSPSLAVPSNPRLHFNRHPELELERPPTGTNRLSFSPNTTRHLHSRLTPSPESREPRQPVAGTSTNASLPPSITLNLNLNNSVLNANFTPSGTNHDSTGFIPGDTNDGTISTNHVNTGTIHGVSPSTTTGPQTPTIEQMTVPTANIDSTAPSSFSHRHRYRVPTRVVSSNSLVAENLAEMRRRTARAELSRRLDGIRGRRSSFSSNPEVLSSDLSGGIFSRVADPEDEDLREEVVGAWGNREGASGRMERVEAPLATRWLRSQAREQTQSQTQTPLRPVLMHTHSHSQSQTQRVNQQRLPIVGGPFGTFGGLGLPPRNQDLQSQNSMQGESRGQSTGVSMYPGVQPPPPRPRYYSVRSAHPVSENFRYERDDSRATLTGDGHRRGASWSEGSMASAHANTSTNPRSHFSGSSEDEVLATLGLDANPPVPGTTPGTRFTLSYGDQQRRNARSSASLSSSGSSLSAESYRSGSTSGTGRGMFLDTELPSPGLGGLFDVLGSGTSQENAAPPTSIPASVFSSPPASAMTFNSSSSGFLSSSTNHFDSSSPLTLTRNQTQHRGMNNSEERRLQRLAERLGNMRDGMAAEAQRGRPRWRSEGTFDVGEGDEQGRDEMDIDEEGRGVENRTDNNFFTSFGSSALMRARPDLFGPPSQTSPEPSRPFPLSDSNPSTRANPSPEGSNIIDPALFAPGPFRNTMETLASRAREYAALASSVPPLPLPPLPPPSAAVSSRSVPVTPPLPFSPSTTYTFGPPSSGFVPGHRSHTSAATTQPPVIPPLAFENEGAAERSEVQEPLNSLSHTREFLQLSEELREQSALQRQSRLREMYQQYQQFRHHGSGGVEPSSAMSSSGSSSSSSLQVSLSQLETSPTRSVFGMSGPGSGPDPGSGSGVGNRRGSGEIEGLQHAIGVLSADGLSVGRSMQFLERYRIESGRGQNRNQGQHHGQSQNGSADTGGDSGHVPRWRYGQQMYQQQQQQQQQLQYRGVQAASVSMAEAASANRNTSASPGNGGILQLGGRRRMNPSWREIIMNPEEDRGSESEEDMVMPRSYQGSRERWESQSSAQSPTRRRMSMNLRLGAMPFERDATSSGPNTSGGRSGGGAGGLMRERVLQRFGFGMANRFGALPRRGIVDPGDYMNDEDFDASYESLLSLQAALGEVKPRSTPEAVLKRLQSAKYKEWAGTQSDVKCPICLDEYGPDDMVMKPGQCAHWLHKGCLEQWLKGANTCPVCRSEVEPPPQRGSGRCPRHRMFSRRDGPSNSSPGSGSGSSSGNPGQSGGSANAGGFGPSPNSSTRLGPFF